MKMSLLSIIGIASWVAIATLAANRGQYLGCLFAVTLATFAALVCGRKAVSAYALAVSAGALGMLAGHFAFLFVIPWPTWVGTEPRIALQQFTIEHLVQFTAVWAFHGAIVGLGAATVTLVARHVLMRDPISYRPMRGESRTQFIGNTAERTNKPIHGSGGRRVV